MNKRNKSIIAFIIIILVLFVANTIFAGKGNLIVNPGFEKVKDKYPIRWNIGHLNPGVHVEVSNDAHSGSKGLTITNNKLNDTLVTQDVKVKKGKVYRVKYWCKAAVKNQPGSANITLYYVSNSAGCKGIYTSKETRNTNGMWRIEEFYFKTRNDIGDPLTLALRLGGQGTRNEGQVIYDDLVMEQVDNPPSRVEIYDFSAHIVNSQTAPATPVISDPNRSLGFLTAPIIWMLCGVLLLIIIAFLKHRFEFGHQNKPDSGTGKDNEDLE
jgi:hypothetical protein